jgi:hypothetical protein
MENLNPCLEMIALFKEGLESGANIRSVIKAMPENLSEFSFQCKKWLILRDQGGDPAHILRQVQSPARRSLLQLLERGLRGESILEALRELETETEDLCFQQMEEHLAALPFKMMVPLLLLLFPSLMMLILGPLLEAMTQGFSGV